MVKKKILIILNYYYPYISGLSEYARLISEKFVQEGHHVTVLTSNHAHLPNKEILNGVRVIRANILFKISKGIVSPQFIWKAIRMAREYDVVNMHLPMLESGLIAYFIKSRNIIPTYHCDMNLSPTVFNNIIIKLLDASNNICMHYSKKIAVSTLDYALTSRIASKYKEKLSEVSAPVIEYIPQPRERCNNLKRIGFCGRIVEEKGIDVLLKAYAKLAEKREDISLIICGDYQNVAGGSVYSVLKEYVNQNRLRNVEFIGRIKEDEMQRFYSSLDILVLPSINSLEAFGMVQVEAMFCGVPVVASSLPGVRTIIQKTGMGELCIPGDVVDLANKISKVLQNRENYIVPRDNIKSSYGMQTIYEHYNRLFFEK